MDGDVDDSGEPASAQPTSVWRLVIFGFVALLGIVLLCGLGVWQLERRVWKLDLIERVGQRVGAPVTSAPGPDTWPGISDEDAYRHISVSGRFLQNRDTLVKAVTERGSGYWLMSPFQTDDGFTVLINRGFVPEGAAEGSWQETADTEVTGLMRMTEPKGGFLRRNDPFADRWYSRDVGAIATAKSLGAVAPYFIDADANMRSRQPPIGGLTVIRFANNHLVYAITWFVLALMLAAATIYVGRNEWQIRKTTRLNRS
ncbi:SURF1 family protein [Phyllobacterium sp. P30BS-XVII]|uniref:SURF1 family protein n=1 Tax=Phyllobacterium sp. P30BS-XVII TaxID=2587046 RepID=UPI0015FBD538|nr:SURF1 family protein [Phyllobacterium sp. P30BS-XVII]MBA8903388.1 surfeit locus 1 family protein [Phyllobacterium sp. P30BS-XVII]